MSGVPQLQNLDLVFFPLLLVLMLAFVVECLVSYQVPPFGPGTRVTRS